MIEKLPPFFFKPDPASENIQTATNILADKINEIIEAFNQAIEEINEIIEAFNQAIEERDERNKEYDEKYPELTQDNMEVVMQKVDKMLKVTRILWSMHKDAVDQHLKTLEEEEKKGVN